MLENKWNLITTEEPAVGEIVETVIWDADGKRNQAVLKRDTNLWFFPDGSMYVYYTPTHWRRV